MAYAKYRITLKSDEQRSAGQPNIIYMMFASDADAILFGENLTQVGITAAVVSADNVSVDVELSTNYALPYPAGTEVSGRCAWGNAAGYRQNMSWSNCTVGFVPITRVNAAIAAGFEMVQNDNMVVGPPSYGNAQPFDLQPSI